MRKILSVAISVYNLENYITTALDSLVNCKYLDKLDVLVINDGSQDRSEQIIKAYAERYPESITFFSKKNEGQGSAYNLAIEKAVGKYFKILDGDDWYDTDVLNTYIELLEKMSSDIVATNMRANADNRSASKLYNLETRQFHNKICYGCEYDFDEVCLFAKNVDMHQMTICTEIAKKVRVLQNVSGYSDLEFALKVIPYVQTITYFDIYLYQYRTGRPGQAISGEGQIRLTKMNKIVLEEMVDYYTDHRNSLSNEKNEYILRRLAKCASNTYYNFLLNNNSSAGKKDMVAFDRDLCQWSLDVYNRCNIIVKCLRKNVDFFYGPLAALYVPYKKRKLFL
ncbi:MAG: glycosyltransferase family 2 protein [Clostridiales bacterium]|nr:glycosyltransferase family 2 protein [Clostridiales bacterium]